MIDLDGPTLRAIRESVQVPLRHVAREAGMSHGHLSKVERGEHSRPVTPAIIAAYEKATGNRLSDGKLGTVDGGPTHGDHQWRRGRLDDARRLAFNASIAGIAVGGPIGVPRPHLVDSLGHYLVPDQVDPVDADLIDDAAQLAAAVDLRRGGGLSSQLARAMLRWALGLTRSTMNPQTRTRLFTGIGKLAHRAGWAAFDADRHHAARNLYTIAVDAAILANDRDLRAHVLADIAAQHNHLRHHEDAIAIIEIVEGDPRITPPVRAVLNSVKARTYAALDQPDMCHRYLTHAEQAYAEADPGIGGWQATIATLGHLNTTTGHALATPARHTGNTTHRQQAISRLTNATNNLNPDTHTRSLALCSIRLAGLHLDEHPDQATAHTLQALTLAGRLRSGRLNAAITALRATAQLTPVAAPVVELIDQHRLEIHSRSRYNQHDRLPAADTIQTTPPAPDPTPPANHQPAQTQDASAGTPSPPN